MFRHAFLARALLTLGAALLAGCGSGLAPQPTPPNPTPAGDYVVFAWNDLGMHCLNPTYDSMVILPPYNNVRAQVIVRGNPPRVVTSDIRVEYRLVDNTTSYGKTDRFGGDYRGFWDNSARLFGVTLEHDRGLNLVDPGLHLGLSGTLAARGDHFEANGIPATPVDDQGTWNPYQVAEITVRANDGAVLAQTRATVPTSDEIDCAKCHAQGGTGTVSIGGGGASAFQNILATHDAKHGGGYAPPLVGRGPFLCAGCHPSPALGGTSDANPGMYLSAVIHGAHVGKNAACYDCHPGRETSCNRSRAHTAADGHCTTCHGDLAQVSGSVRTGGRVPWHGEPKCVTCHPTTQGVDTGSTLYREATGHGGLYCAACHGSPHAMTPSLVAADNAQALQYQGKAYTLGSCKACHNTSRGHGAGEFAEAHGGSGARRSACNICHTAITGSTSAWPHGFTWKSR